jgi:membrane protein implicated in regulation of membrane protease activity
MKPAGFLLLVAGWAIVVAALLLLPSAPSRVAFVLAGIAVQALGLVLAVRSHRVLDVERG